MFGVVIRHGAGCEIDFCVQDRMRLQDVDKSLEEERHERQANALA